MCLSNVGLALEQGINTTISYNAQCTALEEDIPVEKTVYWALTKQSVRDRIQELPELLTRGEFKLNYQSNIPTTLEQLISKRNKLAHVSEPAAILVIPEDKMVVKEGQMEVTVPLPKLIWKAVTLKEAEEYLRAVEHYFKEVLFPGADGHKEGELLLRA